MGYTESDRITIQTEGSSVVCGVSWDLFLLVPWLCLWLSIHSWLEDSIFVMPNLLFSEAVRLGLGSQWR